ncbi:transposase [Luteibacter sp. 329MFSha]|uniref:REP-associated tyrosine transposase n=1 Tax=Luteibacter sp. 329MFSha TaxID=1798239 RepID=UPI0008D63729|nr:transposase [Luteibacter sp. 329MFSha]SEW06816.1 REP element-mobilizing transposase RayT [Luteibacter sp. 329MFSha]
MVSFPASHRLRLGRVSEPGRVYLVTATTWNRIPLFRDVAHARAASRVCDYPKTWAGARCLAWVLMPDHFHGLIQLDDGDLCKVMSRFKSLVSRRVRDLRPRRYPVWQKGFHDAGLREEENVRAAARYLVANPVRAGLVGSVRDYPYWNAVWL